MPPGLLTEALRLHYIPQFLITERRDECSALFMVLLTLLNPQSPGGDNELMDKEGFRDRETNDDVIKHGNVRKVNQNTDERKRQGAYIPFPDGQDSDIPPSRTMRDKFDFVAACGKLLHSCGGNEIDKTQIRNQSSEIRPHLFLGMGEMDGEIDIKRSKHIGDIIQFTIERHDPTSDEQRTLEKTGLAQGAKQAAYR